MTETLRKLLESTRNRRIRGGNGVWRLSGHSAAVEACRTKLFAEFLRSDSAVLMFDDPPPEELVGQVEAAGKNRWVLSPGSEMSALRDWLYTGNFQLWVGGKGEPQFLDLCRMKDGEVLSSLRAIGAAAVIDSFHDNQTWTVAMVDGFDLPRPG